MSLLRVCLLVRRARREANDNAAEARQYRSELEAAVWREEALREALGQANEAKAALEKEKAALAAALESEKSARKTEARERQAELTD